VARERIGGLGRLRGVLTDTDDEVTFSEDEEAALLVALLRWRGRDDAQDR
jgi:hypothetical protein